MPESKYSDEARRLITERCLIAADVDKTIVSRGEGRVRQDFMRRVGPQLIESAKLGINLAFITGNSMEELTERFLRWLLHQLCDLDELDLLDKFHFFCNSGGIYFQIPWQDSKLQRAIAQFHSGKLKGSLGDAVFTAVTDAEASGKRRCISPRFVDGGYMSRCRIAFEDVSLLAGILDSLANDYYADLEKNRARYIQRFSFDLIENDEGLIRPQADKRIIRYGVDSSPDSATVQITVKPILSFHSGIRSSASSTNDPRTKLVSEIQHRMDQNGLGRYVARPGGRTSIDVTLAKLDKAYALEFLIDRLHLEGIERHGQKSGSNAIYLGDEVFLRGGNDFSVTRVPGLLTFAVSAHREWIPPMSQVMVPSPVLDGPEATSQVLIDLNHCAERLLRTFVAARRGKAGGLPRTAVEEFKNSIFIDRVKERLHRLEEKGTMFSESWQAIHSILGAFERADPRFTALINGWINELDAMM